MSQKIFFKMENILIIGGVFLLVLVILIYVTLGQKSIKKIDENQQDANEILRGSDEIEENSSLVKQPMQSWLIECLAREQESSHGEFQSGKLILMFNPELVDIIQAQNLLAQHGLLTAEDFVTEWSYPVALPGSLLVQVPVGEELKWKCILENEPKIISATLNHISRAF